MRNFQKIKEIKDYEKLDEPTLIDTDLTVPKPPQDMMVLRMLVRPKYGGWYIPNSLSFLERIIYWVAGIDSQLTGIQNSWCYVTVRSGPLSSVTDDEWHFDGASFRTDIIPERNYIWTDHTSTEYKLGSLVIPEDFDPIKHNLFTFAAHQLRDEPVKVCESNKWYLLSPFCLHRRPDIEEGTIRTFYRICFSDIEGRDINNTDNPLLFTPFYGRNPINNFRNKLINYYDNNS